jgi:hypothetical protein
MDTDYERGNIFGLRNAAADTGTKRYEQDTPRPIMKSSSYKFDFVKNYHEYFDLITPLLIAMGAIMTVQKLVGDADIMNNQQTFEQRITTFAQRHYILLLSYSLIFVAAFILLLAWYWREERGVKTARFAAPRVALCVLGGTMPLMIAGAFAAGVSSTKGAPSNLSRAVYGTMSALIALQITMFALPAIHRYIKKE